jgi:hypothetical protein
MTCNSEESNPLTEVARDENHEEDSEDVPEHPLRSISLFSRRKKRAFGHFPEEDAAPTTIDAVAPMMLPDAVEESMNSPPQNRKESLFESSPLPPEDMQATALNWSDDEEDDVFDENGGTWLPPSNVSVVLVAPASPVEAVNDDTTPLHHHVTDPEDEDDHPGTVAHSVTSTAAVDTSQEIPESPKEQVAADAAGPPDWDDVLASTEALFYAVPDPTTVTVQDILQSLAAEYEADYIFSKAVKKQVRTRLVELMQQQQHEEEEQDPEKADDQANVVGDSDIGDDEEESVAANESEEEYPTDDDDDREDDSEEEYQQNRRHNSHKKKSRSQSKKNEAKQSLRRPKKNKASSTRLALRVHAEQRRKRRLEELKVRNEELALHQSAVDRERAEQIAAQFQTQTEELRRQRLEQRLDLGHKLNQTRLRAVVQDTVTIKKEATVAEMPPKEEPEDDAPIPNQIESEDSDDELEIEGHPSMPPPPPLVKRDLPPSQRPNDALSLLLDGASSQPHRRMAAPDPRAALRQCLQERQRSMGNRWLARELGYPTEEEHIQVCLAEEQVKRERILQREKARIQADQERSVRLLNDDVEEELEETEETEMPDEVGEEDEEMAMARNLEGVDGTGEAEEGAFQTSDTAGTESSIAKDLDALSSHAEVTLDASEMEHSSTALPNRAEPFVADPSLSLIQTSCSLKANTVQDEMNEAAATSSLNAPEDSATLPTDDASEAAMTEPIGDVPDEVSTESLDSPENVTADSLETATDLVDDEDIAETSEELNTSDDKPKGPRNSAWQAILKQDAEKAKKKKRSQLIEEEADEEEEEEVAGLEDFGFVVHKKKKDDDDDDDIVDFDEDDLKHVVDDLSDDEGDELAGTKARKAMEAQEEKERHKEMLRRMRDGYDGRRGGIAGGGAGARGVHRFDQLVVAENREDAKLLGLLNDDEIDSDNEEGEKAAGDNEEDDEHMLLDKMLKARFLHRSSVEEEAFSDDEDAEDDDASPEQGLVSKEEEEEQEQERLAKRFAKRARMQRLIELHGHEAEFSQSKLMDEDVDLKLELQNMKVQSLAVLVIVYDFLFSNTYI